MVARTIDSHELSVNGDGRVASDATRTRGVQRIGDLMPDVLARYLPKEDVWQERSRAALVTVSKAAG